MSAASGLPKALFFDVFGTCVDWRSGVIAQGEAVGRRLGLEGVDWAAVADGWRARDPPPLETVRSGQYPISRFLYLYTRTKPSKDIKAFIDWATGPEGQEIVTKVGYFPIK
jgi:FMN phosphatase YigB (HAD superfamily)